MWLEEVVPYIITSAEKEYFKNLPTEEERGKFIDHFWKIRDPNPATPENEFKIEFYRRIAQANVLFKDEGIAGWRTERGRIHILLGPPNQIDRDFNPSTRFSPFDERREYIFHGTKEIWHYSDVPNPHLPPSFDLAFIDRFGSGRYVLAHQIDPAQDLGLYEKYTNIFDNLEIISEATKNPFEKKDRLKEIITTRVAYDHVPFDLRLDREKDRQGKSVISLSIAVPYSALTDKQIGERHYYSLTLMISQSNRSNETVFDRMESIELDYVKSERDSLQGSKLLISRSVEVDPKATQLHVLILDDFSGRVGSAHKDLAPPNFNRPSLSFGPAGFGFSSSILSLDSAEKERLRAVLSRSREYCRRLEKAALDFVCLEEISEKIDLSRDREDEVYIVPGAPSGRSIATQIRLAKRKEDNTYLCDFQFTRKGGDKKENRTLLEKNGKPVKTKDAELETSVFQVRYVLFGPLGLLSEFRQGYHDYAFVEEAALQGEKVMVIDAVPRKPFSAQHGFVRLWTREADGGGVRIEWNPKSAAKIELLEARAKAYKAELAVTLITEYGYEKNGIRFPRRDFSEEAYVNRRGKKFVRSRTTVVYRDYKFFTVETDVEY